MSNISLRFVSIQSEVPLEFRRIRIDSAEEIFVGSVYFENSEFMGTLVLSSGKVGSNKPGHQIQGRFSSKGLSYQLRNIALDVEHVTLSSLKEWPNKSTYCRRLLAFLFTEIDDPLIFEEVQPFQTHLDLKTHVRKRLIERQSPEINLICEKKHVKETFSRRTFFY